MSDKDQTDLKAEKISRSMPDYQTIWSVFKKSFPLAEQYPAWMLRTLSHMPGFHSIAFYDGEELCGFAYYINFFWKRIFLLYLAVNPEIRSKGYGSRILTWLKQRNRNGQIILNVEKDDPKADNHEQRMKRIEFYRRNGIYETGKYFWASGVIYEVLSTRK